MVVALQDAPKSRDATFFAETSVPKRKRPAEPTIAVDQQTGRPRAIYLTADQFDVMATALRDSAAHLADVAKFMKENDLPQMLCTAAKMLDEHLPAVHAFSRRAWAEVGPAVTAMRLGRPTRLEKSQEKYARAKKQP